MILQLIFVRETFLKRWLPPLSSSHIPRVQTRHRKSVKREYVLVIRIYKLFKILKLERHRWIEDHKSNSSVMLGLSISKQISTCID